MTQFEEKVLVSLAKLEVSMDQNEKDHIEIKKVCEKIPAIEVGLNNHLSSHTTLMKYFIWPIITAVSIFLIVGFLKVVFKVI